MNEGDEAGIGRRKGVCWPVSCSGGGDVVDVGKGDGGGSETRRRGNEGAGEAS